MTDTVCVPVEPNEAMIAAGERAAWDDDNSMPAISAMRKAWSAMLAASPQGEGGWIKHDGGPNPVPGKTVECNLAGTSFPMAALPSECLNWAADLPFGGSIIAYRVTEGVKP